MLAPLARALLLVACLGATGGPAVAQGRTAVSSAAVPPTTAPTPWHAAAERRFNPAALAALRQAGYSVTPGKVVWYTIESDSAARRVAPAGGFYVNNPLTLYGGIEIPTGQPPSGSLTDIFELDGDAVIALHGVTPPPITYFSFTMNEFSRHNPSMGRQVQTNSSIGLSTNNVTLKTVEGRPFNASFVLLVSAKRSAIRQAKAFFMRQGVPENAINTMLVPKRFTRQSNDIAPRLNFLTRLTYRTEAEKSVVNRYTLRRPAAMEVLYFQGTGAAGDVEDADLPRWEDLIRDDRSEFAGATPAELDMLNARVKQHYAALGYQVKNEGPDGIRHIDPDRDCRDIWGTCNYDAPDATYGGFYCPTPEGGTRRCSGFLPGNDDRAVVVGVNHHRFGQDQLLTYFNYSVTRLTDLQGVVTLADLDIVGSAAPFLPDLPHHADYFVLTVARDCRGEPFCMEVPYEDGPDGPGLPKFGAVEVSVRMYLDKLTGTAPNPLNFLPARVYWLTR